MKRVDQQVNPVSLVPSLEAELEEAHAHIDDLENEKWTHRKKLEQFLRKVSEERRELLGGAESTRRSEQSSTTCRRLQMKRNYKVTKKDDSKGDSFDATS